MDSKLTVRNSSDSEIWSNVEKVCDIAAKGSEWDDIQEYLKGKFDVEMSLDEHFDTLFNQQLSRLFYLIYMDRKSLLEDDGLFKVIDQAYKDSREWYQ